MNFFLVQRLSNFVSVLYGFTDLVFKNKSIDSKRVEKPGGDGFGHILGENNQTKVKFSSSVEDLKKLSDPTLSMKSKDEKKELSLKSKLFSFTSNFIAGMLVLSYVGYQIDSYTGREDHLYLLIGIFLGFIWSMYETFKLVRFIDGKK